MINIPYTIFLDESGNTGSNLLDNSQPLFTLLGLGIKDVYFQKISNEIESLKRKYRIKHAELHASNIFRRGKEKICRDVFEVLIEHDVRIFISLVEKKFTIATFIESDFFDPVYNDKCDNSWTHPGELRNENSNFIYKNLSNETVKTCGLFFSTGEGIEEAYRLILRDLDKKEYKLPMSDILKGAKPHLKELAETTKQVLTEETTIHSPNLFSFYSLVNKIEHYYLDIEDTQCKLVFDSSKEFNLAFLEALERMKNAREGRFLFPGKIPFITGYKSIQKFETEDSKNNIFLQCADLISGSINRIIQKVYLHGTNADFNETELFFIVLIFSMWMEFGAIFFDFMASADLGVAIYKVLDKNKPQ